MKITRRQLKKLIESVVIGHTDPKKATTFGQAHKKSQSYKDRLKSQYYTPMMDEPDESFQRQAYDAVQTMTGELSPEEEVDFFDTGFDLPEERDEFPIISDREFLDFVKKVRLVLPEFVKIERVDRTSDWLPIDKRFPGFPDEFWQYNLYTKDKSLALPVYYFNKNVTKSRESLGGPDIYFAVGGLHTTVKPFHNIIPSGFHDYEPYVSSLAHRAHFYHPFEQDPIDSAKKLDRYLRSIRSEMKEFNDWVEKRYWDR
jgi:hypothetical protein